jgi:hypothetical protein
MRQASFCFVAEAVIQHVSYDEAQYSIAQKFEALIIRLPGASVG